MANSTAPATPRASLPELRLAQMWESANVWIVDHTGQIVIAAILGAVAAAALLGLKWFGLRLSRTYTEHNHWRRIIGKALAKIRLWFVVAAVLKVVANYAHAPDDIGGTINFLFVIASTLQAAVFVREVLLGWIEYRSSEHEGLGSALQIIRLLVTFALFAVASILILSNLGVNVTGLVAGLGIGGIAIGLAAQGIFADLFAALAILFDRPFRRGDSIKFDTISGTVEEIGLKSTRVRSITGELVIIANKQLLDKEIHNLARLSKRRTVTMLGLTYQTDIDLLARMPALLGEIVEGCDDTTFVRCGLMTFGDSSLDMRLEYDVHSEDYQRVFEMRHRVHVAILKRFTELGIDFAYPTQVAFNAAPNGKFVMPGDSSESDIVER